MQPFYNDLAASLAHAWAQLTLGTTDHGSPFRTPVIASVGLDGSPQQRTMILRAVDIEARTLQFNTDSRSIKVTELRRNPRICVVGYHADDKLQLRLSGNARLDQNSPMADSCWANMRDQSRVGYAQPSAPGRIIAAPDHYVRSLRLRTDEPFAAIARENFCLLTIDVDCLDWVFLSLSGNRRAQFTWPNGQLNAQWLAP